MAIEAANFGTWFIHSGTREFITDARLKELFGYYPEEDLSIEQALAQITEEYRSFVADKLENAIYHNGDYDVTYPVTGLHDGQLRWLRAIGNLKADHSGAFSAFTGVVMDVTDQHLAKQKIEESEKHFRHLADLVPAKISNALPNGEVTFFNQKWLDYAGMRFEDMRDFGYHQLMHPDEIAVFQEQLTQAAAKGMPVESEMRFKDINGNYRWHLNIASPVLNENGQITMWVGSTTDIQRMKEEDQRKNDFIGMVSHELKTPLTSLTLGIQMLGLRLEDNEDPLVSTTLNKAGLQVKKMNGLINGFLNVSRLESSKLQIVKETFDLNQLIADTIDETIIATVDNNVHFEPKGAIFVHADRDKISSVISNLLSNAVKYSPSGTLVEIGCREDDGQAFLSVRDEGVGIKKENLEKIFERYYRIEDDSKKFISGFGIGLYLSSEIIQRHNGKITAESTYGQGSTFCFSIPVK